MDEWDCQELNPSASLRASAVLQTALQTLRSIAWFCLSLREERSLEVEVDNSFRQRPAYQEGCLTDAPDPSAYDNLGHRVPIYELETVTNQIMALYLAVQRLRLPARDWNDALAAVLNQLPPAPFPCPPSGCLSC